MSSTADELPEYESDPKFWGPGVWFSIHSAAARVRTTAAFWTFVETFLPIIMNLPCSTCSEHARAYMLHHHPSTYANRRDETGRLIGAFAWTFDLHNTASYHAGNEQVTWVEALAIFSPVLDLTDEQVAADRLAARSPATVGSVTPISFYPEDDEVEEPEAAVDPEVDEPPRSSSTTVHVSPTVVSGPRGGSSIIHRVGGATVAPTRTAAPAPTYTRAKTRGDTLAFTPTATGEAKKPAGCSACKAAAARAAQRTAEAAAAHRQTSQGRSADASA